jgi:hypothetical protein
LIKGGGGNWVFIAKIHAVNFSGRLDGRIALSASVSIWFKSPKGLRSSPALAHWFKTCSRTLRLMGYRGRWEAVKDEMWANYWKRLKGPDDVLKEIRAMKVLQI